MLVQSAKKATAPSKSCGPFFCPHLFFTATAEWQARQILFQCSLRIRWKTLGGMETLLLPIGYWREYVKSI